MSKVEHLFRFYLYIFFFFFATWSGLWESQFPNQGLNPGP